jgi:glycosyltransferase involved in cell wall biosynthesis
MLGADIFDKLKKELPLDLIGMGTKEYGGLGEILHPQLPAFISRYRFFFNPIRYTSFGLAVCEAMMTGMPVVSLATTEYSTVICDGINGFIHTDIDYLCERMKLLLNNRSFAQQLGTESRITAEQKFNIDRFTKQWRDVFHLAITRNHNYYEKANSIYQ